MTVATGSGAGWREQVPTQVWTDEFLRSDGGLGATWVDPKTGEIVKTYGPVDESEWAVVGDVGDLTLAFADFGGAWIELTEIQSFWPVEGGSMMLVAGVAIPVSCSPQEIVEKMKHVLLQSNGGPR